MLSIQPAPAATIGEANHGSWSWLYAQRMFKVCLMYVLGMFWVCVRYVSGMSFVFIECFWYDCVLSLMYVQVMISEFG